MKEHAPRIEVVGNVSAVAERAAARYEAQIAAAGGIDLLLLGIDVDILCDEPAAAALTTRPNNRSTA
ncbi:hypothetical protein FXB40_07680 [Bradyrhizobium rifense]|uniref:Uncharacterized protein n=1 Tax=Bradyrhizobium rifense TaxID=515499 RepID=A0A5D3KJF9_9BRAD|nr:hypothetical protein [Bradyrhizobium rifense]TYL97779.1 hypothetical protein FXB40_07680 [Bradyrhizobium rifense]